MQNAMPIHQLPECRQAPALSHLRSPALCCRKYATMERSRSSASGIPPSPAMDRRDSVDLSSSSRGWMPGLGAATIRGAQANRLISQNHKSHTMKRDKHAAIPHVDSFSNNVQDVRAANHTSSVYPPGIRAHKTYVYLFADLRCSSVTAHCRTSWRVLCRGSPSWGATAGRGRQRQGTQTVSIVSVSQTSRQPP